MSVQRDFGAGVTLESHGKKFVLRLSGAASAGGLFVLDLASVTALESATQAIEELAGIDGLVVIGHARGFVAGADVKMIEAVDDSGSASEMSRRGQRLFRRLERLKCPTVAAIHGACLGGGCELALALDRRIATDDASTKIGLPEVRLGILPAWGGTQRLPRLLGLPQALPMMLSGSQLDARRARRKGLVDRVVPAAFLLEKAIEELDQPRRERRLGMAAKIATWTAAGRRIVAGKARQEIEKGTNKLFPAPRRILEVVLHGLKHGEDEGHAAEARALGELATGPVCKNLIRIFFASESARKLARTLDPSAPAIERALVVGGGVMGAGIAAHAARKGIRTRLVDLAPAALTRATARLEKTLARALKRRRIKRHDAQRARDHLEVSTVMQGVRGRDLVLEAIAEKLEIKRTLYADLEAKLGDDAVLATNTSSLPLHELASSLRKPENFVGLHFFNPPEQMPLVEIIRHDGVSDATLARAAKFATKLGKVPVLVGDGAGFLVNRCLAPYLGQALALCARRPSSVERIDRIACDFGMPMGPLRLLDEIGIDVAESVCAVLAEAFPERMSKPETLGVLSEAGRLGCKSGQGFYEHEGRSSRPSDATSKLLSQQIASHDALPNATDMRDRMILALVLEAFRCLEDGIVATEEELDLAMVFGIGFPAAKGGPIRWARDVGLDTIRARARELGANGDRAFEVPALLMRLADEAANPARGDAEAGAVTDAGANENREPEEEAGSPAMSQ